MAMEVLPTPPKATMETEICFRVLPGRIKLLQLRLAADQQRIHGRELGDGDFRAGGLYGLVVSFENLQDALCVAAEGSGVSQDRVQARPGVILKVQVRSSSAPARSAEGRVAP